MRRVLALLAVAALAAAGPADAAAKKPKPRLPKCLSFTDDRGDAAPASPTASPASPVTGEPGLDLTKVHLSATADNLVVKFTVDAMADNVTKAPGDQFQLAFDHDDKQVRVYYSRSRTRDVEANAFYQAGIWVDNEHVANSDDHVTAAYNVAAKTVTLTVKIRGLKSAVARGIDKGVLENISAIALGTVVARGVQWDQAAPADPFVEFKVGPCTG